MLLNSVVRICAIAFWGLIKLGVYQLCLLAMVFLVDILMFPKSPLIGGEMNVQIRFRIRGRDGGKVPGRKSLNFDKKRLTSY